MIMVVDDHEGNRDVLHTFLTLYGYSVVEAENGSQAVTLATFQCPELIFMDLAMPVMDGFTAVRLLRELPTMQGVSIVAYTANDVASYRAKALRLGFNGFLPKPIDTRLLALILNRFLNRPL